MRNENFDRAVSKILARDNRYPRAAYEMLPMILDYTVRNLHERVRLRANNEEVAFPSATGHVTGAQLSEGFREYILEEFGPFSREILEDLRIYATIDIGNMVYNLISVGCFGKTDEDKLEDFDNVYNFYDAFVAPFEVQNPEFKRA
jgi:uncharacterized repeat protein (TIGR04138 family)